MSQNKKTKFSHSESTQNNSHSTLLQCKGFHYAFNPKKCEECGGKCCYGESGYIFVSIGELQDIAQFLQMSFEELCLHYVRKVGYRFSFIEKACMDSKNGIRCVFFNENTKQCDIYAVRPKQCRTFPFWSIYQKDDNELFQRCIGAVKNK